MLFSVGLLHSLYAFVSVNVSLYLTLFLSTCDRSYAYSARLSVLSSPSHALAQFHLILIICCMFLSLAIIVLCFSGSARAGLG